MTQMRNITMCDEGGKAITVCFWGNFANQFDLGSDEHPVVAMKRLTVSDYNGKSLNSNDHSSVMVNPPIRRTKQLHDWYRSLNDPSEIILLNSKKTTDQADDQNPG